MTRGRAKDSDTVKLKAVAKSMAVAKGKAALQGMAVPMDKKGKATLAPEGRRCMLVLGCSRCRYVVKGCTHCKNPLLKGSRGPR